MMKVRFKKTVEEVTQILSYLLNFLKNKSRRNYFAQIIKKLIMSAKTRRHIGPYEGAF